jgi:hypothetical protein
MFVGGPSFLVMLKDVFEDGTSRCKDCSVNRNDLFADDNVEIRKLSQRPESDVLFDVVVVESR